MAITMAPVDVSNAKTERIIAILTDMFGKLLKVEIQESDLDIPFLEMGVESLVLLQLSQAIRDTFDLKISFRFMLEELTTIRAIASYIDTELAQRDPGNDVALFAAESSDPQVIETDESLSATVSEPDPPEVPVSVTTSEVDTPIIPSEAPPPAAMPHVEAANLTDDEMLAQSSTVERLLTQQLRLMTQQIELLRTRGRGDTAMDKLQQMPSVSNGHTPASNGHTPLEQSSSTTGLSGTLSPAPTTNGAAVKMKPFVPYQPLQRNAAGGLNPQQQQYLEALIERVSTRTQRSKIQAQHERAHLADSRSSAGFRQLWKEMFYPIIAERAAGSRFWDVDGNEYVDITMGYGALFFGHSPSFVIEAVQEEVARGMQLGPQTRLAGEVAALVCELTNMERAMFCNSGTEAVMMALRLARTATDRSKIAIFSGSYHGTFDGVLVRGEERDDGTFRTVPMAPGVPNHMVDQVLMLEYCDPRSLELVRQHAHELAAVLVEPLQSRKPSSDPKPFLQELRAITRDTGIALIFDEVITGFRMHSGGMQALFEVQADIATYGKAVGAGFPIGVVAGKADFLDAVDGGMWSYGDASYPRAETTFISGTFFKHPFVMAAARAALTFIKNNSPQLQEGLAGRTHRMVEHLNEYIEQQGCPIHVISYGSLFRFIPAPDFRFMDLFFYQLLEHGIYIWEGRTCYISTAHTDEDIEQIIQAVKRSITALQDGGFFPTPDRPSSNDPNQTTSTQTDTNILKLTEAQQQVWAHANLVTAGQIYNESFAIKLTGDVQIDTLCDAIRQTLNRHEALRATFASDGLTQQIAPSLDIDIPLDDFSSYDEMAQQEQVNFWMSERIDRPFDLVHGPLVRAGITRIDSQTHLLLIVSHHIVTDGWSNTVLIRDISTLYAAGISGESASLTRPTQFREYIEQQEQHVQSIERRDAEDYWKSQFKHGLPTVDLPTDHPRPVKTSHVGARVSAMLDSQQVASIRNVSVKLGCTPFVTMLGAFQLLLHRLTRQADIVVSIPTAGQLTAGMENLVGYCVQMVPIYSAYTPHAPVGDYLLTTRQTLFTAYDHLEYPLHRITTEHRTRQNAGRAQMLTVVFNMDRANAPFFVDLNTEMVIPPLAFTKAEFSLNITEIDGEMRLDCEYATDLFDEMTIRRWLGHFQTLLESIVANPTQPVARLAVLSPNEYYEQLVVRNDTATPIKTELFPQVFAEQAMRTPEAPALVFGQERITYGELDRRANQLAHYLQRYGVGPEVIVALAIERSPNMIIALLGILKAGGAYLPLDPSYPLARLSFIMDDAQPMLLLTESSLVECMPAHATTICIDDMWKQIEMEAPQAPLLEIGSENAAYVIYTSGSTGQPKGAITSHGSLVNLMSAMQQTLGLGMEDIILQFASLSFDISAFEIVAAFNAGAQLRLASQEELLPSLAFVQRLNAWGITCVLLPPAAMTIMPDATLPHLHTLLSAGEACSVEAVARWAPNRRFIDAYGPTEATIFAMSGVCTPDQGSLSLGRPLANNQIYVLDAWMEPVPIGANGEIYIGGDGVGRGYLNRPEQTAERFVPDPFSQRSGARLYRTGDLARYRSDGELEFLGRIDHQVKVQGHRIELGEIESHLRQHPDVGESVVIARDDGHNHTQLVAYVVPTDQPFQLPEQMKIFGFDPTDTFMIYRNVFVFKNYVNSLQPLPKNACVFDVGANIGIFTLQAHQQFPDAQVYAFEPIPANFDKMRRNMELYGFGTRLCNYGLSNEQQEATFTFYPHASYLSTQYANLEEVHAVMRLFIDGIGMTDFDNDQMDWKYTTSETVTCELRRLSDVMREEQLEQLDLLKIVVERAELDVLNGIDDTDWDKIKQIVIELRDENNRLADVCALLERRGYHITVDSDDSYEHLYFVFAVHWSYQSPTSVPSPIELTPRREMVSRTALRHYLQERLPSYMLPNAFMMLDRLPMTPNGKIDRRALPEPTSERLDAPQDFVEPLTVRERQLAAIWAELLPVKQIGIHDNFFELGGDSILAIQIAAKLNQAALRVTPDQIFEYPTIAELTRIMEASPERQSDQGMVTGPVPLTPVQHWFFEQPILNRNHFNQSFMLVFREVVNPDWLEQAIQYLIQHHDALRLRFTQQDEVWMQFNAGLDTPVVLEQVDLAGLDPDAQELELDRQAATFQTSLDIAAGPVLRAVYFHMGDGIPARLMLIVHHLMIDFVSWRVLFADLWTAYQHISHGISVDLPNKTTSFKQWAEQLTTHAQSDVLRNELPFWLTPTRTQPPRLPVDHAAGCNNLESTDIVMVALSEEDTQALLHQVPKAYQTQINDILLAALACTVANWTDAQTVLVDLEGHGRETLFEQVDLSRTVGWFTCIYPIVLDTNEVDDVPSLIKGIKEQIRRVPSGGTGYGLLRYLCDDSSVRQQLDAQPDSEICFNYLGQFDQSFANEIPFEPDPRPRGSNTGTTGPRHYVIDINGLVIKGQLQMLWTYSTNLHYAETIQSLADSFINTLRELIAHCLSVQTREYTPSDFPQAQLDQNALDKLMSTFRR